MLILFGDVGCVRDRSGIDRREVKADSPTPPSLKLRRAKPSYKFLWRGHAQVIRIVIFVMGDFVIFRE